MRNPKKSMKKLRPNPMMIRDCARKKAGEFGKNRENENIKIYPQIIPFIRLEKFGKVKEKRLKKGSDWGNNRFVRMCVCGKEMS